GGSFGSRRSGGSGSGRSGWQRGRGRSAHRRRRARRLRLRRRNRKRRRRRRGSSRRRLGRGSGWRNRTTSAGEARAYIRREHAPQHKGAPMVTLADARRIIAAAEKKAAEIGQPMNIAVADAGGNLVSHVRMDGAWLGSIDISIKKAYTSRAFDIST